VWVLVWALSAVVLTSTSLLAQTRRATVCNPGNRCFSLDTSVIGGRSFEDYRVTNGSLRNVAERRAILQTNSELAGSLCGVTPFAGLERTLPSIRWQKATVSLHTSSFTNSSGQRVSNQAANIAFEGISTSDGYSLPKFGFILVRALGTPTVYFQFRPSIDANVANVPGLTQDLSWVVNPATKSVVHPRLTDLPANLRRLLLALASNLPELYRQAGRVDSSPNGEGLPVWTIEEARAVAAPVSELIFQVPTVVPAPIRTLTCDVNPQAYTTCAEIPQVDEFSKFLMKYGAQYLYTGDAASRQSLLETYRSWAAADALRTYPGFDPGNRAHDDIRIKFTLNMYVGLPLISTWNMLRGDPAVTEQDRQAIDQWLSSIVDFSTAPYNNQRELAPNNHGYIQAAVKMAMGITTGNDRAFAEGVERYFMALHQMNPDGSLMWEVGRGACSIRYQALAVGKLAAIAEMAASQGYDLYSLDVQGRTLHTAIRFLVDAIANPSLIEQYARTTETGPCDLPPGSPQDVAGIAAPWAGGGTYLAFLEQYVARFPDTELTSRLRTLWPGGVTAQRPVSHSIAGVNTSCSASNEGFRRSTLRRASTSPLACVSTTARLDDQPFAALLP
jgi:poly(beta-D-mannuronate) lyase